MSALVAIFVSDARRVGRDRFLLSMALYLIAISIAMRWLIPFAADELASRADFDLRPYYGVVMSHFLVQLAPMVGGMIGGFLLLETKESDVLRALRVTPVSLLAHLSVLGAVILSSTVIIIVVEAALIGIAVPEPAALFVIAVAASPAALGIALAVGGFAKTKTEAFAYLKFIGVLPLVPTAGYFMSETAQRTILIYPPSWVSRAYWAALDSEAWAGWAAGGAVTSTLWLIVMFYLYRRAIGVTRSGS